ncbi:hypothetical protein ACLXNF_23565 [Mycobacteroides chelonae]|uniref:hypothetical protein n=1 Tax=Mycobacteroides chelonae TaxID=1774 RepID=UPI0039E94E69
MVMSDRWRIPPGMRRTSAVVAIAALAIGGVKIASDHTMPGGGFPTVQTAAADPTGPTGGPGGDGGMNGSQFQPPSVPNSMPDYQGGINQPPLDQNSGISIYNTGSPGAQQVPGQQGAQQPQQSWDQPAHGTQIPDYQTNPGYTQGPGTPNPDYQAPQQQSPQQGNQPQQGQQSQQNNQQPSQAPTQTQQPSQNDQQDQQDRELKQQCQQQAQYYGLAEQMASFIASAMGGFGSMFGQPSRKWGPAFECNCAPEQGGPQKQDDPTPQNVTDASTAPTTPTSDKQQCSPGDEDFVKALQRIFDNLSADDAKRYAGPLLKAMKEFNINSTSQQAAFLAEIGGESSGFVYWKELIDTEPGQTVEDAFNLKYNSKDHPDLINIMPGDGYRFRGLGPIQITGRHNATDALEYLGLIPSGKSLMGSTLTTVLLPGMPPLAFPAMVDPGNGSPRQFIINMLADGAAFGDSSHPEPGIRAAAWFFTNGGAPDGQDRGPSGDTYTATGKNLNNLAKDLGPNDSVSEITHGVNGGESSNPADRQRYFETAYQELKKLKEDGCLR